VNTFRTVVLTITLIVVAAALTGCSYNAQKAITDNDIKLANTYWKLIAIDGTQVNALSGENEAYFILNADGTITGFGGCNHFNGSWEMENEQLVVGPMMVTKMACDSLETETHLLAALDGKVTANLDDVTLTVTDYEGIELKFLALSHR